MGGVVASLAACCACQTASCACSSLCGCIGSSMSKSTATRVGYVGLFFLTSFVALILDFWGADILSWVPTLKVCTPDDNPDDANAGCYGVLAVYRVCFGLTLFHFLFSLIMINVKNSGDPRSGLQDGWWIVKFVVWLCFTIIAFVIPNGFYQYYGYVAFVGAAFFIIFQLLLLVDMAYTWTESWVRNYEENEDTRWYYALVGCTFGLYGFAIAGIVLIFVYFSGGDRSSLNIGTTVFAIIVCLVLSFMSISPKVQEAIPKIGLLQSAVVTLYSVYLLGSAFLSEPCNSADLSQCSNQFYSTDSGGQITSMIIGGLFTIAAVCYSTVRAAGSEVIVGKQENEGLLEKTESGSTEVTSEEKEDDEQESVSYSYSFFHIMFATASMYICQLLTNWSIITPSDASAGSDHYVDNGMTAVWVKVVSSWIVLLLYGWTMVAPMLFPDREWN
eukprot:TRINITY_DN4656_c0_g1_i1.p1 TRINITY_DN4656_c0_g1~~TRINITY_DN4656_c0_g1_i1.p1  ORF type:complete len:445 (-),score=73.64 TRINITY_DN4656_c0_g1_i1:91-1425(-)